MPDFQVIAPEVIAARIKRPGVGLATTSAMISEFAVNWMSGDGVKLMQIIVEEILGADH